MYRWAVIILKVKSRAQWQQKTQKKSYAQLPIHYCNGTMEDMAAIYDPKRCSKKVVLYNRWLHSVNNNLFYICVRLTVSRMATHFTYFYLNLKGLKSWNEHTRLFYTYLTVGILVQIFIEMWFSKAVIKAFRR